VASTTSAISPIKAVGRRITEAVEVVVTGLTSKKKTPRKNANAWEDGF